jgi:hypothetical protein
MTSFHEFLTQLLNDGKVVFHSTRAPHDRPRQHDVALLEKAYQTLRLGVAGPDIPFDPAVAYSAAELLRQASWALVNHDDRIADLKKRLTMPIDPTSPAHHLSADLTLRYLPQIHRRVRGLDSCDPLIELLENLLRRWPLSGVLADVADAPLASVDFGEHPGLLLLYAERLSANDRSAWRPPRGGSAWDYYELVIEERERGKSKARETVISQGEGAHLG